LSLNEFTTESPEATQKLAQELIEGNQSIRVVALHGDLGAGKTCFVQGMAAALGIFEPITSPTFTVINEYSASRRLLHMDLYRLSSPDEVLDLGFEEYLAENGLIAIEWPDRAGDILPEDTVHVHLNALELPNERSIQIRIQ
jgi:tRNA threonylcarbamoyladenosine biosynthesis protein TsaE